VTEWSKAVSLDTPGYHGVLEIPGKMYIRKVCTYECACVRACMRACMRACVRACVIMVQSS